METRLEQRAVIKTCVRAGDSVKDTISRIQTAWGDHALSVPQIHFWFRRFTAAPDRHTKDSPHTGRPTSKRVQATLDDVREQLQDDKHKTVRQIAFSANVSKTTAHKILRKDLQLRKLTPKYVPKVLTQRQKDFHVRLSTDNVRSLEQDPGLLTRIIATDESWVFTYDPRTKFADMEWTAPNVPCPRKVRRSRSQRKTMLILYFHSHGTILPFFHDDGTVNAEIYIESLKLMREAVRRKRPALWAGRDFRLLQDNASSHVCARTLDYFFTVNMADKLWPHLQYSPDLSPCDYWAFPLLKSRIWGHRFDNLEDVKTTVRRTLREIPVQEYQDCFDNLLVRYRKCIGAAGQYFEGQGSRGPPQGP